MLAAPPLVCVDPGHGARPAIGAQLERIGPGSATRKLGDGGGAAGEAPVALAIARRTRALLLARGVRVAVTRTGPVYGGGNIDRARFCNERGAALMVRIHADGSGSAALHGVSTLVPALHRGWTDDIFAASLRAGRLVQRAVVAATGGADRGVVQRADLTGFNWADVPALLVETGFLTNPRERVLLQSPAYEDRVARGLVAGVAAFLGR